MTATSGQLSSCATMSTTQRLALRLPNPVLGPGYSEEPACGRGLATPMPIEVWGIIYYSRGCGSTLGFGFGRSGRKEPGSGRPKITRLASCSVFQLLPKFASADAARARSSRRVVSAASLATSKAVSCVTLCKSKTCFNDTRLPGLILGEPLTAGELTNKASIWWGNFASLCRGGQGGTCESSHLAGRAFDCSR